MKTAVSIPDDVFENAECFARRTKRSRSEIYAAALREYIARHASDEVTDAINRVVDEIGDQKDDFVAAAARRVLVAVIPQCHPERSEGSPAAGDSSLRSE